MIRQDYLLRMIAQFGLLWSSLIAALRARAFPSARRTLDQAYEQVLGINAEVATRLTGHELLARMQFGVGAEAGRERSLMLSALLCAEAELASDADMGAQFYQKSLDLLLATHLQQPELALPDYAPSVAQLATALADYQVPQHTGQLLARYYEQAGAFAQAEDQLYELRAQAPDSPAVRELGEAFYLRMRALGDAELQAGNFSRAEADDGLARWRGLSA